MFLQKFWYLPTSPQSVTSQKANTDIFAATRTSNFIKYTFQSDIYFYIQWSPHEHQPHQAVVKYWCFKSHLVSLHQGLPLDVVDFNVFIHCESYKSYIYFYMFPLVAINGIISSMTKLQEEMLTPATTFDISKYM